MSKKDLEEFGLVKKSVSAQGFDDGFTKDRANKRFCGAAKGQYIVCSLMYNHSGPHAEAPQCQEKYDDPQYYPNMQCIGPKGHLGNHETAMRVQWSVPPTVNVPDASNSLAGVISRADKIILDRLRGKDVPKAPQGSFLTAEQIDHLANKK